MPTSNEPLCSYIRLENGIHKLVFNKANREAVDQLIEHLKRINTITPSGETELIIVDTRPDGLPPLNYVILAMRRFYKETPQPALRAAYLYNDSLIISFAKALLSSLSERQATRRFFQGDSEKEAIEWLLSSQ